jgi:hypothetical protein
VFDIAKIFFFQINVSQVATKLVLHFALPSKVRPSSKSFSIRNAPAYFGAISTTHKTSCITRNVLLLSCPNLVSSIHLFSKKMSVSWLQQQTHEPSRSQHKVSLSGRKYFNLRWEKTKKCSNLNSSNRALG